MPPRPGAVPPIAVQLYSLRDAAEADFSSVLARVGAAGYAGVELAGLHGETPSAVRRVLDDAGLQVASAHVGLAERAQYEAELDTYQELGCDTVVVPFLPPDSFADGDAVSRAAEAVNGAREIAQGRGLAFGYHNHWWELEQQVDDRPALLAFFDRLGPEVSAEVDVYWARVGGVDPTELVTELGDRVALLHVKDGPADSPQSSMVAVGDGVIDVPGVLSASPAARWHIVELDRCDTDMFDAVRRSYDYLVGEGLSRGQG